MQLHALREGVIAGNEHGGPKRPQGVVEGEEVDELGQAIGQD